MIDDPLWLEAAAAVQSDLDAEVRAEAHDLYTVEASRSRLEDRVGDARILLRCGISFDGRIAPERVAGHLVIDRPGGLRVVVPVPAIVTVVGSVPGMRAEGEPEPPGIGSWLREAWAAGDVVHALDGAGVWWVGPLAFVGADHVEVDVRGRRVLLPWATVESWAT